MPAGVMTNAEPITTADHGGMPVGAMDADSSGAGRAETGGMPVGSMTGEPGDTAVSPAGEMPGDPGAASAPATPATAGLVIGGTWRVTIGVDS
ncbi:hypothetical protein A5727_22135 [Mycobacterium sp. ACS4331]|nr:hypothetical protein A5727_22135 [Mycobacterium sp. ACS4331]